MDKYDVGIVGVWQGCNYGSMMTYYALNRAVQSMGKSVLMIDKPLNREGKTDIEHTDTHSRRFAKENYNISEIYSLNDLKKLIDGDVDSIGGNIKYCVRIVSYLFFESYNGSGEETDGRTLSSA